jgi:hypothetical protein
MCFCGNVVELVEEYNILDDGDFIKLKNNEIEVQQFDSKHIDVYIEKKIILELEEKSSTTIDVAVGEVKGEKVGLLFIKKSSDVYGL